MYIDVKNIPAQLFIQLGGIGLPEEVFFRGYLFTRFKNYFGLIKGLVLSSLFFGVGHLISRISEYGVEYLMSASIVGFQTLIAGIILGYLLVKAKSIIVPASSHILLNIFGVVMSSNFIRLIYSMRL